MNEYYINTGYFAGEKFTSNNTLSQIISRPRSVKISMFGGAIICDARVLLGSIISKKPKEIKLTYNVNFM